MLPGNVGRAVLGPFATQESVDELNEQLGANRSLVTQYREWASGLLHGDLGTSLTKQVPAWDLLRPALDELVPARRRRVSDLRSALDPRWDHRGAALRETDGQEHHDRRVVVLGDAGVRVGDLPHPALLDLARLAARDRTVGGRCRPAHAAEVPPPAVVDADARAVRVHRADHARRNDRGARQRLRAYRAPQGSAPVGRRASARPS